MGQLHWAGRDNLRLALLGEPPSHNGGKAKQSSKPVLRVNPHQTGSVSFCNRFGNLGR